MSEDEDSFVLKCTVLGDGLVDKTSLLVAYTQGSFQKNNYQKYGAQFSQYDEDVGGANVKLFFWDINGKAEFMFMRPTFYKGTMAAIIAFSHRHPETFDHVIEWQQDLRKFCGNIPILLWGIDYDTNNDINIDDIIVQDLVREQDFLGYYKVNLNAGDNVYNSFHTIILNLYEKYKDT